MHTIMELLPIGSVIRLKGATKEIMIFGVYQTDEKSGNTYDYIGVVWPEGNLGDQTQILFNHADIEEIAFTGMDSPQRQQFLQRLSDFYASRG